MSQTTTNPFVLTTPHQWSSLPIDPGKLIDGSPNPHIDHRYSDQSQQFHCGYWKSDVGTWSIHYTETEWCLLIQGRIELLSDSGFSLTVTAGQSFLIPQGFKGQWKTHEPCLKLYVIFEPTPQ